MRGREAEKINLRTCYQGKEPSGGRAVWNEKEEEQSIMVHMYEDVMVKSTTFYANLKRMIKKFLDGVLRWGSRGLPDPCTVYYGGKTAICEPGSGPEL